MIETTIATFQAAMELLRKLRKGTVKLRTARWDSGELRPRARVASGGDYLGPGLKGPRSKQPIVRGS